MEPELEEERLIESLRKQQRRKYIEAITSIREQARAEEVAVDSLDTNVGKS